MVDWMDVRGLQAGAGEAPRAPEAIEGLLDGLNEPQRAAVTHAEGPLLILAGPGSGKTRVVTHRIAWLVTEHGVRPDEILAITFTNQAAREMRERVERMLPLGGSWICTFHSMCARFLRREIEVLGGGWTRDFSIYDTSDRNALIKKILREKNYDRTRFRPAAVGGWISDWKNGPDAGSMPNEGDGIEEEVLSRVMRAYEEALRSSNALDFDDLLLKTLAVFENHPGVRDAYSSRFRFVSVDEYQDTNRVQYLLTRHLSSYHGNVAVCGDPDQSIYAWRGADLRNILDFEQDFGAPRVIKLEQNYRSTRTILAAAQAVIRNNSERKEKDLWSEAPEGERVCVLECGDENDEGREVAMQIRSLEQAGASLDSIAVFYRANFMQRALETQLSLAKVSYQVVGGVEFYARREVRDLIAYLKLVVNPTDDVAFMRVINSPRRGVGDRSLEKLAAWAADRRLPLLEAARSAEVWELLRGRARKGVIAFSELMDRLGGIGDLQAATAMDALLEEIDVQAWLAQLDDGLGTEREANVDELHSHASEFDKLYPEGGLRGFLQDIALVGETDGMDGELSQVTLMTLHAAKGLEFPHVFIIGLEEELLPHYRAIFESDGDEGLEEERRLLYVGMTRARERLFLTHAACRLHFGQESTRIASRFLEEIPSELVEGFEDEEEETGLGAFESPKDEYANLRVGEAVVHDHFGRGTIEALQGSGVNARATVHFPAYGSKHLLLAYAKLQRLR
ncbi:MAG: UvrD-helicase domain-containing protein [Planctomycetota bacterium]|nr:UvrD-helicase domain-containing protein [Planctomycetota bacterium]